MPVTKVVLYKDGDRMFIEDWLNTLLVKAQAKCIAKIGMLKASGHELRRPAADYLRDGIYELRPSYHGVNYRILYFFHGQNIVVLSHGIMKKSAVLPVEISRAVERKKKFETDPAAHGLQE